MSLGVIRAGAPIAETPVGTVQPYAGTSAPSGWLLCDGSAVSRTSYSELFGVISTTYGAGDGSTTFNLPDLRGRVPAGKDDMGGSAASRLTSTVLSASNTLGATGGSQTHTLAAGELPAHTHPAAYAGYSNGTGTSLNNLVLGSTSTYLNDATQLTGRTGQANSPSGGSHNNTQPTLVLNYIIYATRLATRVTVNQPPQYVTSLPASPTDGQEVYYAADATNGVIWHLRYRGSSSSSYKWEFVGGGSFISRVSASVTATSSTPAAKTGGPSFTLPLAGTYRIGWGAMAAAGADYAAIVPYYNGTTLPGYAADAAEAAHHASTKYIAIASELSDTVTTASQTLELYYKSDSGTATFIRRWMRVTPVRVG